MSNILKEPNNVKFQKISTRSNAWKTKIVDVEGAVELLGELGMSDSKINSLSLLALIT